MSSAGQGFRFARTRRGTRLRQLADPLAPLLRNPRFPTLTPFTAFLYGETLPLFPDLLSRVRIPPAERFSPRARRTENLSTAGQGFEPRYPPSKGGVLPLDDPAIFKRLKIKNSEITREVVYSISFFTFSCTS